MPKKDKALRLAKHAPFVSAQDHFFSERGTSAKAIFELGIWDGGSTAFWFEYFQPDKLVAVDFLDREDDPEFLAYVNRKDAGARLKTYWRTDQSDRKRLAEIVAEEFGETPLDLVIDDASHELHATKASFETLFPLLRPGGLYIIEDWVWETVPCYREPGHPWAEREGLVSFVQHCVSLVARGPVQRIDVLPWFAAIERQ